MASESTTYRLNPKAPLAKILPNYADVETITRATTNKLLEPDLTKEQWLARQQAFEIQELEKLFKDPEFVKAFEATTANPIDTSSTTTTTPSPSSSVGDKPGTSGLSKKRPGDPVKSSSNKKAATPSPTTSTTTTSTLAPTTTTAAANDEMVYPGAGNNQDVDMGAADIEAHAAGQDARGYSGGFAGGVAEQNIYVDKPLTVSGGRMVRFGKVHRMLTYGLSHEYLPLTPAVAGVEVMTSSLAGIPWECAFYYMNPGELLSLEVGAKAHACHIRIVQRNPRVAFETNTTTTTLATLNQNKFGLKAIGLNKLQDIRMADVNVLTVQPGSDNMKPATIALETVTTRNTLDSAMYGVSQGSAQFTSTVPAQPFMIPLHYNKYAGFFNTTNGVTNQLTNGWYDVSKHIDQFDMGATVGMEIVNQSYKFKDAPLKAQLPYTEYLNATINGVNYANMLFNDHNTNKEFIQSTINGVGNLTTSAPSETQSAKITSRLNYNNQALATGFRTFLPLEKIQFSKNIDSDTKTSEYVQPSIHVGISPVPRLTTNTTTIPIQPQSWTDVQAYFEITATMEVFVPYEHHNTFQTTWHKPSYKLDMADGNMAVPNVPIKFGHFPQTPLTTTLVAANEPQPQLFKRK